MRYYLNFIDNDLMFFNVVQFDCEHLKYTEGQRQQ